MLFWLSDDRPHSSSDPFGATFPPGEGLGAAAPFVILSEGRSPKSKDLRTECLLAKWKVRRSFDSLCSLRMTDRVLRSISNSWIII